jgi:hypothetical protein
MLAAFEMQRGSELSGAFAYPGWAHFYRRLIGARRIRPKPALFNSYKALSRAHLRKEASASAFDAWDHLKQSIVKPDRQLQ